MGEGLPLARQEEKEKDLSFHLKWLLTLKAKGCPECSSNPLGASQDCGGGGKEEKEAEGERVGREESRVKFSSSPFVLVRIAGSSQEKSRPHTHTFPMD